MKWAVLVVRILVGIQFAFAAIAYFLKLPIGEPPTDENALKFMGAMIATHFFDAVKVLELLGAVLLLSGRLTPLGLVVLVPITVNIAFWDIFIMKLSGPPMGFVFLSLEGFVMWGYWPYFAPFFKPAAKHV